MPRLFPSIIRDHMEPVQSMASGRMHDSKSALRREYAEMGYVELGNDAPMTPKAYDPLPGLKEDIAASIEMLEQGYECEPAEAADPDTRYY